MNLFILSQYKLIQELYKNDEYLDILLSVADFFDLMNLFAFPNWENAEIVNVDFLKYFTVLTLRAPYYKMPHPKGGLLLTKLDCHVKYHETKEAVLKQVKSIKDTYIDKKTGERKPKVIKRKCWQIDIMIPNKYLINDNIFDLEAMQAKVNNDKELNKEMFSSSPEEMEDEEMNMQQPQTNSMNQPIPAGAQPNEV